MKLSRLSSSSGYRPAGVLEPAPVKRVRKPKMKAKTPAIETAFQLVSANPGVIHGRGSRWRTKDPRNHIGRILKRFS